MRGEWEETPHSEICSLMQGVGAVMVHGDGGVRVQDDGGEGL